MKTEIVQLDINDLDIEAIKRAAAVVDRGGLVAFPTETVYGVACRVDESSLARLDAAKGRPGDKRYSLHIGSAEMLGEYLPAMSLAAKKLVSNLWPGPLTVVFELNKADLTVQKEKMASDLFDILYQGSTIGVRCPDNPVAIELLKACKWPVVAPSANLSGQPAAITADQVIEQLDGRIDMLLAVKEYSQACDYKLNSTVVKVYGGKVDILRDGAVSASKIWEISRVNILFVCTGNTCRSPIAEYICKKYISEKIDCKLDELFQNGYNISSAGVYAYDGTPASAEVVKICEDNGIDASIHKSRCLTTEMVERSDVIFAMTGNHLQGILSVYRQAESKCLLLDGEGDIADPIGGSIAVYEACAEDIDKAIELRLCEIMR